MLGVVVWMAMWWVLEPVPLCITALLPLALFPFCKIMNADAVARQYWNDTTSLMLGTFILSLGIQKYQLHKRMALRILLFFGGDKMDPRLVLLSFVVAPAFVSMWVSNAAASIMMIPMATGERELRDFFIRKVKKNFAKAVVLGITFATAIGGMATINGSGPNMVLAGVYSERFPRAPPVTFLQWMLFALPFTVPFLIFEWLLLCLLLCPSSAIPVVEAHFSRSMVEQELESLGCNSKASSPTAQFPSTLLLRLLLVLVLLWCTRTLGNYPGWSNLFDGYPNEGTVSIVMAILLFLVPNKMAEEQKLMDWSTCKRLPWDVILLLGGGFALSAGIEKSKLSLWLGSHMRILHFVPYVLLPLVVAVIINIITEFTANAATATLFLPLLADVTLSLNLHPLLLMIPATFASNFSFMLPVATPPNAIARATGYIHTTDLMIPGLLLKLFGTFLLTVLMPTLGTWVFGLDQPIIH
ncbi:unnamed protein product [Sphagnum jensenii]|uniref:Uncharacterized protein n=1 Tax=Sphagnum jensenii TaxID=128206 RepID=A0ABP1A5B4_9BRYO